MKKRHEFLYYISILKKKFWIIGVFGVYLSLLIFTALLDQLIYNLGLNDLHNVAKRRNKVIDIIETSEKITDIKKITKIYI